jgi:uncharacterized membrane-anchored protein
MLIRLLIIVIIAAVVFYLMRRYFPQVKGQGQRVLPLLLSPAIFPLLKRAAMLLIRLFLRR